MKNKKKSTLWVSSSTPTHADRSTSLWGWLVKLPVVRVSEETTGRPPTSFLGTSPSSPSGENLEPGIQTSEVWDPDSGSSSEGARPAGPAPAPRRAGGPAPGSDPKEVDSSD
jgi:hypothetical protein